uniref:Tail fibers protein n=1 Tax=Pseudomonas phage vB_PaPhi_Mx1 TaxID=3079664 RepID=A0AAU0N4V4_9CAUD
MTNVNTTAATEATLGAKLVKKPATVEDFRNNVIFHHTALTKLTEVYNEAVVALQTAERLSSLVAGDVITFDHGKGEKAEVLSGEVISVVAGVYQVLVRFSDSAPAKLLDVKASAIRAVQSSAAQAATLDEAIAEGE